MSTLATPTAVAVGIGLGARRQILIKDAETLEKMAEIRPDDTDESGLSAIASGNDSSKTGVSAPGWAVPLGTVGGVFSALFGTGGPIYTIYLARRVQDKGRLRATISLLLFMSALARLASFVAAGLFSPPGLPLLIATMLPCALAGMYLGTHLHHRLPAHRIVQAVWAILIVGGATLVLRNV